MPRGAPAQVMGIMLMRDGDDMVVLAEDISGRQVELIRERAEGPISHNISEHGINSLFGKAFWIARPINAADVPLVRKLCLSQAGC